MVKGFLLALAALCSVTQGVFVQTQLSKYFAQADLPPKNENAVAQQPLIVGEIASAGGAMTLATYTNFFQKFCLDENKTFCFTYVQNTKEDCHIYQVTQACQMMNQLKKDNFKLKDPKGKKVDIF